MKAYWIYPETVGFSSEFSEGWIKFCEKLGYGETPPAILIIPVQDEQF